MHLGDRAVTGILAVGSIGGVGSIVVAATTKSDKGPWLAPAGALIVAVLTAVFTDRRQRAQLAHDRELQDPGAHEVDLVNGAFAQAGTNSGTNLRSTPANSDQLEQAKTALIR